VTSDGGTTWVRPCLRNERETEREIQERERSERKGAHAGERERAYLDNEVQGVAW
jgi:hypothetical protein